MFAKHIRLYWVSLAVWHFALCSAHELCANDVDLQLKKKKKFVCVCVCFLSLPLVVSSRVIKNALWSLKKK